MPRIDEPLAHVLWIGGPPNSGKTSIARLLAGRHDLRVYNSDAHTWEHHDKAVARTYPAAARWESMTPDEAWLSDIGELVAISIAANEERCRLMIEDLDGLPRSPLVVIEGTPLFPSFISTRLAGPDHAVWLLPSDDFQSAGLRERPRHTWEQTSDPKRALENRIERERIVGERIEEEAVERGLHVIRVDGSRSLEEVAAEVEAVFGELIAAGPVASTTDGRRTLRREDNLQVHSQVSTYFERVAGAGDPAATPVPFACECGAAGCNSDVETTLVSARRIFDGRGWLVAAPHEA